MICCGLLWLCAWLCCRLGSEIYRKPCLIWMRRRLNGKIPHSYRARVAAVISSPVCCNRNTFYFPILPHSRVNTWEKTMVNHVWVAAKKTTGTGPWSWAQFEAGVAFKLLREGQRTDHAISCFSSWSGLIWVCGGVPLVLLCAKTITTPPFWIPDAALARELIAAIIPSQSGMQAISSWEFRQARHTWGSRLFAAQACLHMWPRLKAKEIDTATFTLPVLVRWAWLQREQEIDILKNVGPGIGMDPWHFLSWFWIFALFNFYAPGRPRCSAVALISGNEGTVF